MQYWPQNREQKRLTTAFLVGESVSYFAAPGALVLAEDYMPNQSKAVKEIIAIQTISGTPWISDVTDCAVINSSTLSESVSDVLAVK